MDGFVHHPVDRPDPVPAPALRLPVRRRRGCCCATCGRPSRGPAELGRLVVLASPRGEPQPGASYPLDAVTNLGRDVNNGDRPRRPVRVRGPRRPDLPRSQLVHRGPRQHQRDLSSTACRSRASARSGSATRSRSARSGSGWTGAARERRRPGAVRAPAFRIRPRPRGTELALLGDRGRWRSSWARPRWAPPSSCARRREAGRTLTALDLAPPDPQGLLVYLLRAAGRPRRVRARGPPHGPGPAARRRPCSAASGCCSCSASRRTSSPSSSADASSGSASSSSRGCWSRWPSSRRSPSRSARTPGCAPTSTRGRRPASCSCC